MHYVQCARVNALGSARHSDGYTSVVSLSDVYAFKALTTVIEQNYFIVFLFYY